MARPSNQLSATEASPLESPRQDHALHDVPLTQSLLTTVEASRAATVDGPVVEVGIDVCSEDEPAILFGLWFSEAERSEINDPNAMALATTGPEGFPDVRMVLLKEFDASGFVFFTNSRSIKGRQLGTWPSAAAAFHWKSLRRQVRIRGRVELVSESEADAYFASRPQISKLAAWASQQSECLPYRAELDNAVARQVERFGAEEIPRPPHWNGYRIVPSQIEFWKDMPFRLHHRLLYAREGGREGWTKRLLYP
jgi:pyridoxamine 5'-phosphate oxidase